MDILQETWVECLMVFLRSPLERGICLHLRLEWKEWMGQWVLHRQQTWMVTECLPQSQVWTKLLIKQCQILSMNIIRRRLMDHLQEALMDHLQILGLKLIQGQTCLRLMILQLWLSLLDTKNCLHFFLEGSFFFG
jgi:hypothetical protein